MQRESLPADKVDVPEGLVSNFLNDSLSVGDLLSVHMPGGDFILREGSTPVVLLSGGAGITAMLCMLEHLASPVGGSRDVLFMHATRGRQRHAFNEQVRALATKRPGIKVVVLYEEAEADDKPGQHHDLVGRITAETLTSQLKERDADFLLLRSSGIYERNGSHSGAA